MSHSTWLAFSFSFSFIYLFIYLFIFEAGSTYVVQASLKLTPASAFQVLVLGLKTYYRALIN
jgi:hypothetical protein